MQSLKLALNVGRILGIPAAFEVQVNGGRFPVLLHMQPGTALGVQLVPCRLHRGVPLHLDHEDLVVDEHHVVGATAPAVRLGETEGSHQLTENVHHSVSETLIV